MTPVHHARIVYTARLRLRIARRMYVGLIAFLIAGRAYPQNQVKQPDTELNRIDQYGGRLGGPIIKNKLFFSRRRAHPPI